MNEVTKVDLAIDIAQADILAYFAPQPQSPCAPIKRGCIAQE